MCRRRSGLARLLGTLVALAAMAAFAQSAPQKDASTLPGASRIEPSDLRTLREAPLDAAQARSFGLNAEEWGRYRELMRGALGIYSPNLDPLTALGVEARSTEERRHIAELQVRMEARRAEKTLAYQRAYDEAWKRLYPSLQPVRSDAAAGSADAAPRAAESNRLAVFVKEQCPACDARVRELQASGALIDIYVVGTQYNDARIRTWAKAAAIDPANVRAGRITLNHDAGRWLALGAPGGLPAVMHAVNGRWQRQ